MLVKSGLLDVSVFGAWFLDSNVKIRKKSTLLVHHLKEKIAPEVAEKIACFRRAFIKARCT